MLFGCGADLYQETQRRKKHSYEIVYNRIANKDRERTREWQNSRWLFMCTINECSCHNSFIIIRHNIDVCWACNVYWSNSMVSHISFEIWHSERMKTATIKKTIKGENKKWTKQIQSAQMRSQLTLAKTWDKPNHTNRFHVITLIIRYFVVINYTIIKLCDTLNGLQFISHSRNVHSQSSTK